MNKKIIPDEVLSKIKLVCSDVDGTLVEEGKANLNPAYYDEIRRLKEKGIKFAVVSGRGYAAAKPLFEPVMNEIFMINDNGAVIHNQDKLLKSHTLDIELAREIARDIEARKKDFIYISALTGSYASSHNDYLLDILKTDFKLKVHELDNVPEDLPEDAGVFSLALYDDYDCEAAIGQEFMDKWNSHGKIQAFAGGSKWFNVIQKSVNKGSALLELMELYGLKDEEVLAIGDNMNDMPMLTAVTNTVAIGNARPEIKEVCRFEADTFENDGVLQILKRL